MCPVPTVDNFFSVSALQRVIGTLNIHRLKIRDSTLDLFWMGVSLAGLICDLRSHVREVLQVSEVL